MPSEIGEAPMVYLGILVCPLAFGFVPSHGVLELTNAATVSQSSFKLSELLRGTTGIHTLKWGFEGEKVSTSLFLQSGHFFVSVMLSQLSESHGRAYA